MGEARGIVKSADNMNDADLATISFGQTNTVNAVQYMTAFNAIVNGGTLIQPHVMKSISHTDSEGNTIIDEEFEPKTVENVISESTAATLRDYLERTVNQGGSNKAYIRGYHIGAKQVQLKRLMLLQEDMNQENIFHLWLDSQV